MMFLSGALFTDLDQLAWFSRYKRFCEPRYLFVNMSSNSHAAAVADLL